MAQEKHPKLCKDCRHYRYEGDQTFWNPMYAHRCWHPYLLQPGDVDLVTGEQDPPFGRVCHEIRRVGFACGPKGKLWEAKTDFQES